MVFFTYNIKIIKTTSISNNKSMNNFSNRKNTKTNRKKS